MARQLTYAQRFQLISKWKEPPGASEQLRLERAERMVKETIDRYELFQDLNITVAAKGSYPNKTNVRGDSDVDIKVQLNNCFFYDGASWLGRPTPYSGTWTAPKLRAEVERALVRRFGDVDTDHNIAFYVPEVAGSRPSIDVVPCFKYVLYDSTVVGGQLEGSIVFGRNGKRVVNWPELQFENGREKNKRTNLRYKFVVRVLKNVENDLAAEGVIKALPSYFSECLIYNVPDHVFLEADDFDHAVHASLCEVRRQLTGISFGARRMVEPNEVKKVFGQGEDQRWTEKDGRELIEAAVHYLGYGA